jgi:TonB family protein
MRWICFSLTFCLWIPTLVWGGQGSPIQTGSTSNQPPASESPTAPDSTVLELVKKTQAVYPIEAAKDRLQGQVTIKIVVSEAGDVEQADVLSGNPVLAEAALHAVKKYKFKPFIRNGKAVKVSTKLPFDFAYADNIKDIQPKDDEITVPQGKNPTSVSPNNPSSSESSGPGRFPDSLTIEALDQTEASYPVSAIKANVEGAVTIRVAISQTGEVASAELVNGDPMLAEPAITAAKQWKFKTWIDKKYVPVRAWADIKFDFKISDEKHGASSDSGQSNALSVEGTILRSGEMPTRVHLSQGAITGLVLHKVRPVYPPAAKAAHIQGTVVMQAVISKEGTIKDLATVSGPRELVDAAMGAVQQWRYRPYMLEGEPIEVDTLITVNFSLTY